MEEDPFEEIVLEPRKKPVVWVVYVLLFAVAVPWYWPTGYSGHAVMGLPLWVAVTVAAATGLDPVVLLIVIGTCISFTFLNPFSHQSNLMVMGPGGYSTAVFFRFGVPLTLVSLVSVCVGGWARRRCLAEC